jgi:hypothetical protein
VRAGEVSVGGGKVAVIWEGVPTSAALQLTRSHPASARKTDILTILMKMLL